jgi:lipoprotein NlpI
LTPRGSVEELLQQVVTHWKKGETGRALQQIQVAVEAYPKDSRPWSARGQILAELGQREAAITNYTRAIMIEPTSARLRMQRGSEHFRLGNIAASVADFDEANRLDKDWIPKNWQRGIALYYAGRFADAREQFEQHQKENPRDVENAVWHFLCVAREDDFDTARSRLMKVTGDPRVPMAQIQRLFSGEGDTWDVIQGAETGTDAAALRRQRFYAHFYVALYHEARNEKSAMSQHLVQAVALASLGDYMGDVAKVHAKERLEIGSGEGVSDGKR